jgi:hypothetical protein
MIGKKEARGKTPDPSDFPKYNEQMSSYAKDLKGTSRKYTLELTRC